MKPVAPILVATALLVAAQPAHAAAGKTTKPEANRPSKIAVALEMAIDHPERFPDLRIEVEGFLDAGARSLTVYGRGFGVWNRARQIKLSGKQVRKCLKILKKSGFLSMPERIVGSKPPGEVTQLLRSVTLVIGEHRHKVEQDNKAPESQPFREMVAAIVAVCRPSAEKGVTATDLTDGLRKIADGALAPELLEISANAPELRSLPDQAGQGWLVQLRHGALAFTPHSLANGYGAPTRRALTESAVRDLARLLIREKVSSWPGNLNLPGYLQLSVRVLDRHVDIMARRFAGRPAPLPAVRGAVASVTAALRDLPKAIEDRSR